MKTTASLHTILDYIERRKLKLYTRPNELNIIGIRSMEAKPNSFDDIITVICKRTDGDWEFNTYPATTDPGNFWLSHPLNVKGAAILKPGQYIGSHQLGMHRQKYKALVQVTPVTVW